MLLHNICHTLVLKPMYGIYRRVICTLMYGNYYAHIIVIFVNIWLLLLRLRLNPLAVFLNRLAAPRLVFIFGIKQDLRPKSVDQNLTALYFFFFGASTIITCRPSNSGSDSICPKSARSSEILVISDIPISG